MIAFTSRQTTVFTIVGFSLAAVLGIGASVILVLTLAWLVVRLALTLLQATIEGLSSIGATYTAASPDAKLLVLLFVAIALYSFFQKVAARRARP
jgi:hypothetical protein